eukprot:gnl/Trimastix_PCT/2838.p1 GENE.gnl/Trimastix_PCT/2838~~gnl/Trimastix_PCT/2838.p1  ORF type:complete len:466 (+),score=65.12 gnl/Trimastix_PCT/2838:38-1399(+)
MADSDIRSFYCTTIASSFGKTLPIVQRIAKTRSGFSGNQRPFVSAPLYPTSTTPLELPKLLASKAKVSRRLEYEGDVFGSMYKTAYGAPVQSKGDEDIPSISTIEHSGFTSNSPQVALREAPRDPNLHPRVVERMRRTNPIDAEHAGQGPLPFETTTRAAHRAQTAPARASTGDCIYPTYTAFARSIVPAAQQGPAPLHPEVGAHFDASRQRVESQASRLLATSFPLRKRWNALVDRSEAEASCAACDMETVTKRSFAAPQTPTPEGPQSLPIQSSGFTRSMKPGAPIADRAPFVPLSQLHPRIAATIRRRDPMTHAMHEQVDSDPQLRRPKTMYQTTIGRPRSTPPRRTTPAQPGPGLNSTGFRRNALPFHSSTPPPAIPFQLTARQKKQARVSKRLEYEGDALLGRTITQSSYADPGPVACARQAEEWGGDMPRVVMTSSGYVNSVQRRPF